MLRQGWKGDVFFAYLQKLILSCYSPLTLPSNVFIVIRIGVLWHCFRLRFIRWELTRSGGLNTNVFKSHRCPTCISNIFNHSWLTQRNSGSVFATFRRLIGRLGSCKYVLRTRFVDISFRLLFDCFSNMWHFWARTHQQNVFLSANVVVLRQVVVQHHSCPIVQMG